MPKYKLIEKDIRVLYMCILNNLFYTYEKVYASTKITVLLKSKNLKVIFACVCYILIENKEIVLMTMLKFINYQNINFISPYNFLLFLFQ